MIDIMDNGTSTTDIKLTNPGIISRLKRDIADYLSPFGYRLNTQTFDVDGTATAVLTIPGLPASEPVKTVHIYCHDENLVPTIGPLIRTYLRLSDSNLHPGKLKAVVDCKFAIRCKDATQYNAEKAAAKRMAHHIHMIIRNSMGSALCLDFVLVLPSFSSENRSLSVHAVKSAMDNNIDTCYPCVTLRERSLDKICSGVGIDETLYLHVKSRMCTVRHQPRLFRWLSSPLSVERIKPIKCDNLVSRPIVVACIEKVANLHRILMLCHDYDISTLESYEDGEIDKSFERSFLLLNVVVAIPREVSECSYDAQPNNPARTRKNKKATKSLLQYFDEAIEHFHSVVFDGNKERYTFYRPTMLYEDECIDILSARAKNKSAAEQTILGIDLHPNALTLGGDYEEYKNPHNLQQHLKQKPNHTYCAMQELLKSQVIVFGYESTGIPDCIQTYLNAWVQIPSRSSLNVVASMSILFDAIFRT
jgi:hypothetical protein